MAKIKPAIAVLLILSLLAIGGCKKPDDASAARPEPQPLFDAEVVPQVFEIPETGLLVNMPAGENISVSDDAYVIRAGDMTYVVVFGTNMEYRTEDFTEAFVNTGELLANAVDLPVNMVTPTYTDETGIYERDVIRFNGTVDCANETTSYHLPIFGYVTIEGKVPIGVLGICDLRDETWEESVDSLEPVVNEMVQSLRAAAVEGSAEG